MRARIPPVPEDLEIVQRSIDRLARWMRAERLPIVEYWRRWKIVMFGFLHDITEFPRDRVNTSLTVRRPKASERPRVLH